MIGRLRGILIEKRPPSLCVDVGGIGYELEASMNTCAALPEIDGAVTLFTHLVVREDAHQLYGFGDATERQTFRELIKVSGIGPKVALAILSGMDAETFARCIQEGDSSSLTRLPGIGKKTAERLIVEMRDRLSDVTLGDPRSASPSGMGSGPSDPVADAVSALISLGFKPQDASRKVQAVPSEGLSVEEIVREALRASA